MKSLVIKNGYVINPASSFEGYADVLVRDGLVAGIGSISSSDMVDCEVVDASGMVVCPGLIDIHVHFRDPGFTHKEDIESGAAAAAAGGFTTVLLMANTNPKIDSLKSLEYVMAKAASQKINIRQEAALTKDFKDELVDMELLFRSGAAGFTNDGVAVMNTDVLRRAMVRARELGAVIALHEEDNRLIEVHGINKGDVSDSMGIGGAFRSAEDTMVARDCMLALETGATIDIQHISSGVSVNFIRFAKSIGVNVFAEATPHHFTLTEDDVPVYSTLAKMNPPLRTAWDREEIIRGLADDTIEIIATDHAPHSMDEKNVEFAKAPSGITGLETALALSVTELVKTGRLGMSHMISKMTVNPSKYYNLDRGDISVGKVADICIFDPDECFVIGDDFKSKSKNSPFVGRKVYGRVRFTICNGEIVYRHCSTVDVLS